MKKCIICGSKEFKINSKRFCSQKCIHLYGIKILSKKIECEICGKKISKSNISKHLKTHQNKIYHYFCENCGNECFEKYGGGRFCSEKCARGFSTKSRRKEINEKVSKKLSKKYFKKTKVSYPKQYKKICKCGLEFKTNNKNKKYCSNYSFRIEPNNNQRKQLEKIFEMGC